MHVYIKLKLKLELKLDSLISVYYKEWKHR